MADKLVVFLLGLAIKLAISWLVFGWQMNYQMVDKLVFFYE